MEQEIALKCEEIHLCALKLTQVIERAYLPAKRLTVKDILSIIDTMLDLVMSCASSTGLSQQWFRQPSVAPYLSAAYSPRYAPLIDDYSKNVVYPSVSEHFNSQGDVDSIVSQRSALELHHCWKPWVQNDDLEACVLYAVLFIMRRVSGAIGPIDHWKSETVRELVVVICQLALPKAYRDEFGVQGSKQSKFDTSHIVEQYRLMAKSLPQWFLPLDVIGPSFLSQSFGGMLELCYKHRDSHSLQNRLRGFTLQFEHLHQSVVQAIQPI